MSVEFRGLQNLAKEIEARAGQGGFPTWAEKADTIAQQAGRSAQLIEDVNGPEYFIEPETSQTTPAAADATAGSPAEPSPVPNFYLRRAVEGLVLPSVDQLVTDARAELKDNFGRDFEVPESPVELFDTLRGFAERGITGFDEVYYLPGLELQKGDRFWKGRGRVRPKDYFWEQIRQGNYPKEVATLEEGWYIGDRRVKPMYADGWQRYGEDDYMEPLMAYLRASNRIEKYKYVPDHSRFGASPQEIEGVILPAFAEMSGARGIVRNRRYIASNVLGNMRHPELGQTDTWEWYGDPIFRGDDVFFLGDSGLGGLVHVDGHSFANRDSFAGFSLVVGFPSKPR